RLYSSSVASASILAGGHHCLCSNRRSCLQTINEIAEGCRPHRASAERQAHLVGPGCDPHMNLALQRASIDGAWAGEANDEVLTVRRDLLDACLGGRQPETDEVHQVHRRL